MADETMGERIYRLRKARRWSLLALSRHTGISPQTLYRMEAPRDPSTIHASVANVLTVARVFGISLDELVLGRSACDGDVHLWETRLPGAWCVCGQRRYRVAS